MSDDVKELCVLLPGFTRCCTYDFTAAELQELCLRMDEDVNASATEAIYYTTGPPPWRSNGLTHPCQRVVTFQAYLSWARHRGINVIPELKGTAEPATLEFLRSNGKSREDLADMFLEELQAAGFNQPLVPSPSAVVSSPLKLQWLLPTQPKVQ